MTFRLSHCFVPLPPHYGCLLLIHALIYIFCLFLVVGNQSHSPLKDNENAIARNKNDNEKSDDATGTGASVGLDQVDIIDGKSPTTNAAVESESSKIERLENELRIAKELIQSLKAERKKLRSDKNDLLQQVKHLCSSLQEKEQELRNFIRKFDQRIRDTESSSAKTSSDSEQDKWTLMKHAHEEAERSLALAAQLNIKDIQLQRMEQQLLEARRQLSGCISEQDQNISIISPSGAMGMMNHGCDENEGIATGNYHHERGSYSADSGVRTSDRESAAGDLNLSDGACDNDILAIDSDSISLISSHHNMNQCKFYGLIFSEKKKLSLTINYIIFWTCLQMEKNTLVQVCHQ